MSSFLASFYHVQAKEEEPQAEQEEQKQQPEKPKKKGWGSSLLTSVVKAVAKELDDPKYKPRKISYIHVSSQQDLEQFRATKKPWIFDQQNFEQLCSVPDIKDREEIQRNAIACSQHLIKTWQDENPDKVEAQQFVPLLELHQLEQ